jgi:hypothetical protein
MSDNLLTTCSPHVVLSTEHLPQHPTLELIFSKYTAIASNSASMFANVRNMYAASIDKCVSWIISLKIFKALISYV